MSLRRRIAVLVTALFTFSLLAVPLQLQAQDAAPEKVSVDQLIDGLLKYPAKWADYVVFFPIEIAGQKLPIVLIILAGTALFLTIYFGFINIRGFGIALKTARGKYTPSGAPGDITHFQALSTALSATVGLGNIAGVAIAIGIGGPGATFWMILLGLFGMTTKFAECTLGVKYREFDKDGRVRGGAMYYLSKGLKERGLGGLGAVLAIIFAVFVIGGAFGAGNMYQANQSAAQVSNTFFEGTLPGWVFGVVLAVLVGMVIIGGIIWIARVTSFLVPFMCALYMLAAFWVIGTNADKIGPAFALIFASAFGSKAVLGGIVGVLIQGFKRAAFSNEAGLGSAPIAHAAVKTDKPASEGFVALLEPFVDTVVVCTMTALVIIIAGTWRVGGEAAVDTAIYTEPGGAQVVQQVSAGQQLHLRGSDGDFREVIGLISDDHQEVTEITGWVATSSVDSRAGIPVTSMAFEKGLSFFPAVLAIAVFLFAFSTMIAWSYYGEQGVRYLFRGLGDENVKIPVLIYKFVFCLLIVVGASASLGNVLMLSDAMVFAMVIPNLIGVYLLLPVIKGEANSFLEHVRISKD